MGGGGEGSMFSRASGTVKQFRDVNIHANKMASLEVISIEVVAIATIICARIISKKNTHIKRCYVMLKQTCGCRVKSGIPV